MSEGVPAGGPYRAAVGMHDVLTVEHLRAARRLLSIYCRSMGFCSQYLSILERSSRLISKSRLHELPGTDYKGVDKEVIDTITRMVEFYSKYISGVYILLGEEVLVKATSHVEIDGRLLMEGDITTLTPGKALSLYLAGIVEPVESSGVLMGRTAGTRER
ncbi:MAG: hypothetical protein GSR86_06470 [Desulfurococcales archaeon]|nr:hypothetical protein [Desulfurococcales archaeon]